MFYPSPFASLVERMTIINLEHNSTEDLKRGFGRDQGEDQRYGQKNRNTIQQGWDSRFESILNSSELEVWAFYGISEP